MEHGQMTMWLAPEYGGSYTRLRLVGSAPTAMQHKTARRFVRELAQWSGWPVRCVLSVDREAACWCEWWTGLLAGIPERHLELDYRVLERAERNRGDL